MNRKRPTLPDHTSLREVYPWLCKRKSTDESEVNGRETIKHRYKVNSLIFDTFDNYLTRPELFK